MKKFSKNYEYSFELIHVILPFFKTFTLTPYVGGFLTHTYEKTIFLDPKNPKHKRFIETFFKKTTLKDTWEIILRGYPFFCSAMPFLLFFKRALTESNIVLNDEKFKKQIAFLETFITALGAVKDEH